VKITSLSGIHPATEQAIHLAPWSCSDARPANSKWIDRWQAGRIGLSNRFFELAAAAAWKPGPFAGDQRHAVEERLFFVSARNWSRTRPRRRHKGFLAPVMADRFSAGKSLGKLQSDRATAVADHHFA